MKPAKDPPKTHAVGTKHVFMPFAPRGLVLAHNGQEVTVIEHVPAKSIWIYRIRAEDGWVGSAFITELGG